jgi:hypothetical protein
VLVIPTSMDDDGLRQKARAAIQSGRLPTRRPERTWGGRGSGAPCAICDVPVRRDDMELEIEFVAGRHVTVLRVHTKCFAAWELEC